MPDPDDLISVEEATKEFGVSVMTLYRHMNAGRLTRYERPSGRPRVFLNRQELRRLFEPRRRPRKRR